MAEKLEQFARLVEPYAARLDAELRRHLRAARRERMTDPRQVKALLAITAGAAAKLLSAGGSDADFFEQAGYNSRRLAKLNVAPAEVTEALGHYDRELDDLLAHRHSREVPAVAAVRQQLHYQTLLVINNSYYQVREAETQAFYGLMRAEMEATSLDDLLQRFILILTRTFRAQAGRMFPLADSPALPAGVLKRLALPRYVAGGTADEKLIVDRAMRGEFKSYWSIPFSAGKRLAGLIQFGFSTAYRWLPRELDLLNAFAERCLRGAERVRLMQDLAAREEQVRSLAGHLLQAEEEERRRISRELHDETGQSMLFLRLHLEMLEKAAPAGLQPKLAEARVVTERIIGEVRRIIAALHSSAVEELGLAAAVRHLGDRFRKLCPVKLRMQVAPCLDRLPHETAAAVYRVVQECFHNISKHSRATSVNLSLKSTDKSLELNVEDNGVGFDADRAQAQPKSFGLAGMRERVVLLGGRLEIRSRPGHGTQIHVCLPVSRQ